MIDFAATRSSMESQKKQSQNNISNKMILNEIFAKISLHHLSISCLIDHLAIEI